MEKEKKGEEVEKTKKKGNGRQWNELSERVKLKKRKRK